MKNTKKFSFSKYKSIVTYVCVIIAFVIIRSLIAGGSISNSMQGMLVPICAYICMAVSLNLTVGILGELSLGHAGFMSVGAFSGLVTAACLVVGLSGALTLQRPPSRASRAHSARLRFVHATCGNQSPERER